MPRSSLIVPSAVFAAWPPPLSTTSAPSMYNQDPSSDRVEKVYAPGIRTQSEPVQVALNDPGGRDCHARSMAAVDGRGWTIAAAGVELHAVSKKYVARSPSRSGSTA